MNDTSYVYINSFGAIRKARCTFSELNCGLYINEFGIIAYKAKEMSAKTDAEYVFLTSVYNADEADSINGGQREMRFVVDTATFKKITSTHFADKNHHYVFSQMHDGGTITVVRAW